MSEYPNKNKHTSRLSTDSLLLVVVLEKVNLGFSNEDKENIFTFLGRFSDFDFKDSILRQRVLALPSSQAIIGVVQSLKKTFDTNNSPLELIFHLFNIYLMAKSKFDKKIETQMEEDVEKWNNALPSTGDKD